MSGVGRIGTREGSGAISRLSASQATIRSGVAGRAVSETDVVGLTHAKVNAWKVPRVL